MSIQALDWAFKASCPSSSAKLVLLVYANFPNEHGRAYPSTETVSRLSGLNPKTVRTAIDALEADGVVLLIDTGKRVGRTGNVKVYALNMEGIPIPGTLPGETCQIDDDAAADAPGAVIGQALPKTGGLQTAAKAPVSGSKGTRNRVADPVREPIPLEEANASSAPQGAETISAAPCSNGSKGRSEGWTVPPITSLPPEVQAIARQWPAGAYETQGAGHAAYLAGLRRVRNPDSSWHARIVDLGEKPLRAAKAGLRYASTAASPATRATGSTLAAAAHDPSGEGAAAAALRSALKVANGEAMYQQFFEPCRYDIGEDFLTVVAPSEFVRNYLRAHYSHRIEAEAHSLIGDFATVGWEVQLPA